MKKKILCIIIAIFIMNLSICPKVYGATDYTTLSEGSDFLFKLTSIDDGLKALEIYKQFEAGISTQGFNYGQLAQRNDMTSTGIVSADINQGSPNVGVVTNGISELFKNKLGCVLDTNTLNMINNVLQAGFHVNPSTFDIFIYSNSTGSSYTCIFKLLSGSLTKEGNRTVLTIVPTEITVNVSISITKIFGITIDSHTNYNVHVNASSYVFDF